MNEINKRLNSLDLSVEGLRQEMNERIGGLESKIMNIFKLNGFKMVL